MLVARRARAAGQQAAESKMFRTLKGRGTRGVVHTGALSRSDKSTGHNFPPVPDRSRGEVTLRAEGNGPCPQVSLDADGPFPVRELLEWDTAAESRLHTRTWCAVTGAKMRGLVNVCF